MNRSKRKVKHGVMVFFIPLIVLIAVLAFAFFGGQFGATGTLVVGAQSSDKYYHTVPLHISATVVGSSGTTPFNLSLRQGYYTVYYSTVAGYATPAPKSIAVPPGQTVYAIGVYNPIPQVIGISASGLNATNVAAMHSVTPVLWTNQEDTFVIIDIANVGRFTIDPGQTYVHVFAQTGQYAFRVELTNSTGTILVY